jgi:hypothetical protein
MYLIYLANNMNKERFYILLESKLGDVKPLIDEQSTQNIDYYTPDPEIADATNVRFNTGPLAGKDANTNQWDIDKSGAISMGVDTHTLMMVLSIATAFIPLVGPFISAGIQLGDAALYESEGNTKMAGLTGMFAFLPGIGSTLSKIIPSISKLGPTGFSKLATKISGKQALSPLEKEVVEGIGKNSTLVQQELNQAVKQTANNAIKNVINQGIKQSLLNIGKNGFKMVGSVAPYVGAGIAYDKAYDEIQKDTPAGFTKNEQWGWDTLKSAFGSSGSKEDNELLKKAWSEGWRPGTVVPEKYQTTVYKTEYEEELANIAELESLVSGL